MHSRQVCKRKTAEAGAIAFALLCQQRPKQWRPIEIEIVIEIEWSSAILSISISIAISIWIIYAVVLHQNLKTA